MNKKLEDARTVGSIETTKEEKMKFAEKSKEYNRNDPTFKRKFKIYKCIIYL